MLELSRRKKFSTYLMTTFVVLVSLSMLLILGALHRYFGKQVESEFYEKLLAQKGQVEIILKNRFSEIRQVLQDLGSDNIILVTVMLEAKTQLQDRIIQNYPPKNGVYCFVKKIGETSPAPGGYPALPPGLIEFAITQGPYGDIVEEGKIEKRVLGKSGIEVPVVSVGLWAIGGDEWGPTDDRESLLQEGIRTPQGGPQGRRAGVRQPDRQDQRVAGPENRKRQELGLPSQSCDDGKKHIRSGQQGEDRK